MDALNDQQTRAHTHTHKLGWTRHLPCRHKDQSIYQSINQSLYESTQQHMAHTFVVPPIRCSRLCMGYTESSLLILSSMEIVVRLLSIVSVFKCMLILYRFNFHLCQCIIHVYRRSFSPLFPFIHNTCILRLDFSLDSNNHHPLSLSLSLHLTHVHVSLSLSPPLYMHVYHSTTLPQLLKSPWLAHTTKPTTA